MCEDDKHDNMMRIPKTSNLFEQLLFFAIHFPILCRRNISTPKKEGRIKSRILEKERLLIDK